MNDKNKNLLVILVMILLIAAVSAYVYLTYFQKDGNNQKDNNQQEIVDNNEIEDDYNRFNFEEFKETTKDYDNEYVDNKVELPKVLNDENFSSKGYTVTLNEDGTITVSKVGIEGIELLNITGAIDIDREFEGNDFYILLADGSVYHYDMIDNYENENYYAEKLDKISDATEFAYISVCNKDKVACESVFGVVDKNNIFIELIRK